ncbi:hypothetical protein FEM48_Zijuj02G0033200 [Ziziphus jujuba var. spinosa]|uniref:Prolamin-like domain-containing protein n=1 Tax=Ziziphus jujuba var. spinosa TaxID=714518 RepID=A0A978VTB4_ZIZJJ|nr:hypothetical protein FEM48_Zijuj02G0033200 [Ziziphus jujuba var. spinosa]
MFMNSLPAGLALNPAPSPSDYKFLVDCANTLSDCGKELYLAIFQGGGVSFYCCDRLVMEAGKLCNDDLVQYVVTKPSFKGNVTQVLERSDRLWNLCEEIVQANVLASNPSSL